MILGYLRQDYEECRLKITLPITIAKKTSNILIAGKSASGQEAIEMIIGFYDFFTEVRSHRVKLQHYYTLFIEE